MKRWLAPVMVLLGLWLSVAAQPATESAGKRQVWLVELDGPVGPASVDLVLRAIDDAADAGAEALVVRLDTPGGLDKAMRDLIKGILRADLPVVTFVAPDGARAASAGTYIAYASHVAAMAPATNIGSSTPVSLAPSTPTPPGERAQPQPGDDGEDADREQAPLSGDAMSRKVINDAVAYLQSLAELRGRNIEWAEETVRRGSNLRASEALEQNVIDLIAADLPDLLKQLDGREITLPTRTVTLRVQGAGVRVVETDWRHELLTVLTDPSIAYGLLIFGIYGLVLEFYSPGMIFPSVIGIVCLLLGAYGLQMLPINYAGLALIVVGIGMMLAELFTPTMGVLGVGGLAAFVIGSIILMDTDVPGYQLPLAVIGAFAATTAALSLLAVGAALRSRKQHVTTGPQGMIGGTAEALEDFAESGRVFAFGEIWQARADAPVSKGQTLTVTGLQGLTLTVTRKEE